MSRAEVLRTGGKLALSAVILFTVYHVGVELGKRSTHRKIATEWNRWFGPTETAIADDPFGGDPFAADPFADPFIGEEMSR